MWVGAYDYMSESMLVCMRHVCREVCAGRCVQGGVRREVCARLHACRPVDQMATHLELSQPGALLPGADGRSFEVNLAKCRRCAGGWGAIVRACGGYARGLGFRAGKVCTGFRVIGFRVARVCVGQRGGGGVVGRGGGGPTPPHAPMPSATHPACTSFCLCHTPSCVSAYWRTPSPARAPASLPRLPHPSHAGLPAPPLSCRPACPTPLMRACLPHPSHAGLPAPPLSCGPACPTPLMRACLPHPSYAGLPAPPLSCGPACPTPPMRACLPHLQGHTQPPKNTHEWAEGEGGSSTPPHTRTRTHTCGQKARVAVASGAASSAAVAPMESPRSRTRLYRQV